MGVQECVCTRAKVSHTGTLETVNLASADEPPGGRPSVNSTTFLPDTLTTEQQEFLALFRLDQSALNDDERFRLSSLLLSYRSIFACSPDELGHTKVTTHQIPTGDSQPIRVPAYRTPHHLKSVLKDHIDSMLDNGIISLSTSPWSSPVVLVRKKDGSYRFCVDFRKLNAVTEKDSFPLPRIELLGGAKSSRQVWCSSKVSSLLATRFSGTSQSIRGKL